MEKYEELKEEMKRKKMEVVSWDSVEKWRNYGDLNVVALGFERD